MGQPYARQAGSLFRTADGERLDGCCERRGTARRQQKAYCGTGSRLNQEAVTSPSSLVVTGIRAPPVHTPMKPSAYARRCYVTVRVQSAGFGGEGDYVVSTMVNGEQVPTTKPSSLLLT